MSVQQEALEELLEQEPFRPFRIVTSSGREYPVTIPRLVIVLRHEVFYAWADKDRFSLIPLDQITSVDIEQKHK